MAKKFDKSIDNSIENPQKGMWFLCLSDDEECPEGYEGYVFPDYGYEKCITQCRNRNEKNIIILPNICLNDEEIINTDSSLTSLILESIPYLAKELNEFHGMEFGDESWHVMIGMWLQFYVPQLYDKYTRIIRILELDYSFECITYSDSLAPSYDYTDFYHLICTSEEYNCYIYSEIIRFLKNKKIKCISRELPTRCLTFDAGPLKLGFFDFVFRLFHVMTRRHDKVVLHGTYFPSSFLIKTSFKFLGLITNYYYIPKRCDYLRKSYSYSLWRNNGVNAPNKIENFSEQFTSFFYSNVKRIIPQSYVERFDDISKEARHNYKYCLNAKTVIFSAIGVCSDEPFKRYLMDMKSRDCKMYIVQHGGCYGIDEYELDVSETRMVDYQYTWGWKEDYSFGTICKPMPATKLMDKRANINISDDNGYILYVANSMPKHLVMWHRDAFTVEEDREGETRFFKQLDEKMKCQIKIRLFPDSYGRDLKDDFCKRITGVSFDSEKNFYLSVARSKICLFPVFCTTFLEAINQGKPCIAFRRKGYVMKNAEKYIDDLEKTGVICHDWEQFYATVNEALLDVKKWWNDPIRIKAVQSFRNRYAYNPPNADEIWLNELANLLQ